MIRIMFVCHGNICRSPMAEFIMRDMVKKEGLSSQIQVASSATSREEIGNGVHDGTRRILKKLGISCDEKRAVQLTKSDYEACDYIIAMDRYNLQNINRIIKNDDAHKVSLLMDYAGGGEVADPWYTGDFSTTFQDISAGCHGLLQHIRSTL